MERFIRHENIKRYRKLLLETKDDAERRLIQKLLTAEEQQEPPESSLPMLPANAMREQPPAGLRVPISGSQLKDGSEKPYARCAQDH